MVVFILVGNLNPADLMTKVLSRGEIDIRLAGMSMRIEPRISGSRDSLKIQEICSVIVVAQGVEPGQTSSGSWVSGSRSSKNPGGSWGAGALGMCWRPGLNEKSLQCVLGSLAPYLGLLGLRRR